MSLGLRIVLVGGSLGGMLWWLVIIIFKLSFWVLVIGLYVEILLFIVRMRLIFFWWNFLIMCLLIL